MTEAITPSSILRLRPDLQISIIREAGQDYHYLKDPASRRFFRLRANEYQIARGFDGRRSIEELSRSLPDDIDLSINELMQFAGSLHSLGLLADGNGTAPVSPRVRTVRSLLFMKVPLVNPDRLLDRIVPRLGFLYSWTFTALSLLLLLAGAIAYAMNWARFNHAVTALNSGRLVALSLAGLFALRLVVASLHELAHGAACKHHGGSVQEIGFMLLVLQPAFYCDVSDAWMFDRPKRLAVDFAGLQFELLVWSVAVIAWALAPGNPLIAGLAPLLVLVTGFDVAINLNPLIRLDGYYLLSDLTGIPNLRARAFDRVLAPLRHLFRRPAGKFPPLSPRRQIFLWGFGILSLVYTAVLVVVMALVLIGIIVKYLLYALAFVIVVWLLNVLFRRRRRSATAITPTTTADHAGQ